MRPIFSILSLSALLLAGGCSTKPTASDNDPEPVASLTLSSISGTVSAGQSVTLTATIKDAGGQTLTGRSISWSSSNIAVATVLGGVVTGVTVGGPVTITATSEGKNATAEITVTATPVATVSVTPGTASVMVGATTPLTATARDASNNALPGRVIAWSSNALTVATVVNGVVTGVAPGTATITAGSEGKTASAQITVTAVPVANVTVTGAGSVEAGQTIALTAVARDASNNEITGRAVTWESSSLPLATVSGNGVVTGVAVGAVTITARMDGVAGTKAVTITPAPIPVWSESNELRIGGGGYVGFGTDLMIAPDGRAVSLESGRIYERSAGGVWSSTAITLPGATSIYNAIVDPNGMFWVSGNNGTIARRTAGGWVTEVTGTTETVYSVAIQSDGRGFAVGIGMVLERSTTGVWTRSTLLAGYSVLDVGMPTSNFALAIGSAGNGIGTSARWDGSTWTTVAFTGALTNFRPSNLLVVSPTEAYAVGIIGTDLLSARYTIAEWNGTAWIVGFQRAAGEVYPYPAGRPVRCANGTINVGYRYGAIYRKTGSTWSQWTGNGETAADGFVLACDTDNAILVGGRDGMLLRSTNGAAWSLLRWYPDLNSIAIGSPTNAFVTTGNSVGHLASGAWVRTPIPLPNGAPVVIPPVTWAQGSNALVSGNPAGRFNGTNWTWTNVSGGGVGHGGIWGTSITQAFAVGVINKMDTYNGSGWSTLTGLFPGVWSLDQIHGSGSIAVAGSSYGVLRFDGTSWSAIAAPPGGLGVLRVLPGGDIYNVKIGRLQRWTGADWAEIGCTSSCFGFIPTAVAARAIDEIYAFLNGTGTVQVHRFNGTSWQLIQTLPGQVINATWAGNQGIAVGVDGLVLRANTNFAIKQR